MRIASFNINSLRAHLGRCVTVMQRHDIDVMALQETKCSDKNFPAQVFHNLGYEVAHNGTGQWNGVAVISRVGLDDVRFSFDGQPGFAKNQNEQQSLEPRAVSAVCGGVRVWSLYVPNGRDLTDPHYDYKLRFLDALAGHAASELTANPTARSVYVGDFNVAQSDEDVVSTAGRPIPTHTSVTARQFLHGLVDAGLTEVTRPHTPGQWTFADYQGFGTGRNDCLRIDYQFATPAAAAAVTHCFIDQKERCDYEQEEKPSDHTPVIVDYNL